MNKIALFTLGWFVGSGIATHIIITIELIKCAIRKKKNRSNKNK